MQALRAPADPSTNRMQDSILPPEDASGKRSVPEAPMRKLWPLHLLGKLTQTRQRPAVLAAETLLLPLIAMALGLAWSPQDPLWTGSAFPWAWLAPVVLALRYGPLSGLGGAAILLLGWLALNIGHWDQFPQVHFLGGLILVMIVGEFSSLWQARARRSETLQLYLDQRLEHLVRQHYLLRLSHDRLEQELIGRPMSMRDALATLQALGAEGSNNATGAQALLRLLAQYCQLESAGVYAVHEDLADAQCLAALGSPPPLLAQDPLVRQALETHRLCHISQALAGGQTSHYLAVAPLLDLAGEVYGLLAITEMPFFALQTENLQTINLLLGYYTDGLSMQALAQPIMARLPNCPPAFAFEAQRLAHMQQSTQVSSIVVVLECLPRAVEQDVPAQIHRFKRELDEIWEIPGAQRTLLAILMPLGNAATAEGYIARLETWLQQKSGQGMAQAGIFPQVMPLDAQSPVTTLQRLHAMAHA